MKINLLVLFGLALLSTPLAATADQYGDFTYSTNGSAITITGYTGAGGAVTIPGTINGLPVTSIGNYAFYRCSSLTSVTIPGSVTSIGICAFCGGYSLTGVYFHGNAPSIGQDVFCYANNVTVHYLPGTIGWGATFGGRPTALWNPMITANGLGGNAYLNSGDTVTITLSMNPMDFAGLPVDWWVVGRAGSSWWYENNSYQWIQYDGIVSNGIVSNCHPVHQGGLFNLTGQPVLTTSDLPKGLHTFWFAVDSPMDGILDLNGPMLFDSVNVHVE